MLSKYEQIVEEQGIEAAKEYMRSLRARVKKPSGVASLPEAKRKRIMAKARAARNNEAKLSEKPSQASEAPQE